MRFATLRAVLGAFPGKRILVAGDVMLDEYIWGAVQRISPEAPVPVVDVQKRTYMPGGAANTATNVTGGGGQARVLGVIGADTAGSQLRETLHQCGVDTEALVVDPERPTITKTRIVAHSQHVVRVDQEKRVPLGEKAQNALLERALDLLAWADACVVSDYAKGVVFDRLAEQLIAKARRADKPVIVDPKGNTFAKYRGATLIKPNLREATVLLNAEVGSTAGLLKAGKQLLSLVESDAVLITRGPEGMSLFQAEAEPVHIPAEAHAIFDVTGAGDTVAGMLAMGLAAGATFEQSARLANQAAAIVVGKVGTVPASLQELLERQAAPSHKVS
jgi:D-beta-D-heptose 7-phosphate kinase/D-beta-D-heptose 1-phosphate adenosyltransferase